MESVLPLAAEYGAAIICLTMDDDGIPSTAEQRLAVARKIVERAEGLGIPREDLIVDCLTLTAGADSRAGLVTLETIRMVREELGANMTLGASNVSCGRGQSAPGYFGHRSFARARRLCPALRQELPKEEEGGRVSDKEMMMHSETPTLQPIAPSYHLRILSDEQQGYFLTAAQLYSNIGDVDSSCSTGKRSIRINTRVSSLVAASRVERRFHPIRGCAAVHPGPRNGTCPKVTVLHRSGERR